MPDTGAFQSSPKNKFPGLDSAHTAKRINRKRKDARARHTTNNNSKQRHLRTHGPSGPERTLDVDVSVYVLMRHLLSYVIRGDARHTARWGGGFENSGVCIYKLPTPTPLQAGHGQGEPLAGGRLVIASLSPTGVICGAASNPSHECACRRPRWKFGRGDQGGDNCLLCRREREVRYRGYSRARGCEKSPTPPLYHQWRLLG